MRYCFAFYNSYRIETIILQLSSFLIVDFLMTRRKFYSIINSITISTIVIFSSCNAQQPKADSNYEFKQATRDGIGKYYMGREIAHVMSAAGSDWLDRASRPQEENTQLAIDKIKVPATGVIADIGAGTGYYTFKLAPKVAKGKVYAVEIQDELIAELKEKSTTSKRTKYRGS